MRKKQEYDKTIGPRIKKAREELGYTQEKLAELTDLSVQFIAKVEAGKVGFSVPNFKNFCSILGVSADYLLWGEREENNLLGITERLRYLPQKQYKLLEGIVINFMEAIQTSEEIKNEKSNGEDFEEKDFGDKR